MKAPAVLLGALALATVACGQKAASSGDTTSGTATTTAGAKKIPTEAELAELSVDDVEQRIAKNDGTFHVFDANNEEVFKAGHVPTAKWVPFSEVKADMLPERKTDTLVFYCANPR